MTKRLLITGLVQGVGFRYSMWSEAARHGVTGWVRNRRDGSVEAVIEGTDEVLEALIAWARIGPRGARVASVQVSESEGTFADFEQRPTQ
jgi:acylphosphatase